MSYNVLREPWIPMSDGHKYSLWDCLEHAHEMERISCASPLETYAVHRFLCAFVMDALQLPNKRARLLLLKQGRFDMAVFDAYVGLCEQEDVSFDLFDKNRPFMQAGYNPKFDLTTKPVAALASELPSGNNHIFLEHILMYFSVTASIMVPHVIGFSSPMTFLCSSASKGLTVSP